MSFFKSIHVLKINLFSLLCAFRKFLHWVHGKPSHRPFPKQDPWPQAYVWLHHTSQLRQTPEQNTQRTPSPICNRHNNAHRDRNSASRKNWQGWSGAADAVESDPVTTSQVTKHSLTLPVRSPMHSGSSNLHSNEQDWTLLDVCFGIPLFDDQINKAVCKKIAAFGLCRRERYVNFMSLFFKLKVFLFWRVALFCSIFRT